MNLNPLLDLLRAQEKYRRIVQNPAEHSGQSLGILRAARPFVAAALAVDSGRPLVIATARVDRANNLAEQLIVWAADLQVITFAEPNPIFYQRSPWGANATRARLQALTALAQGGRPGLVVVTSARALMQITLPRDALLAHFMSVAQGAHLAGGPEALLRRWVEIGYEAASVVTSPGTFSRRGGILDIFPIDADMPVRIELWGDEVESLRAFDPASQRSLDHREEVSVPPAREALPLWGPEAVLGLKDWFSQFSAPTVSETPLPDSPIEDYEKLSGGQLFPTMEFYLPWMVKHPASLLNYLPPECLLLIDDWQDIADTVADLEAQALSLRDSALNAGGIPGEMPLPLIPWDQLSEELTHAGAIELGGRGADPLPLSGLFGPGPRYGGQIKILLDDLSKAAKAADQRAIVVTRQAARLAELWYEHSRAGKPVPTDQVVELPPPGAPIFVHGSLAEGWKFSGGQVITQLLTDAEIFGWQRPEPRRRLQRRAITPEDFFADLQPGDYVVHVEYGIGRFLGLEKRIIGGTERELLALEYSTGDMLYVPIYQVDRLTRYVGVDDSPPELSRLGTAEWARVKESARHAVEETARELLALYAARELAAGHAFSPDTPWQYELEASFPYVETDDQMRALAEIKADMERSRPMDRLVCGDVGYGKTEVALRAAFKAVMDGKQVALLVPTTVLAQQHYDTFSRRLAPFPVRVEMLSRFRTPAEQTTVINALMDGTVDIVIGTHRLLGRDVAFKELGLLVIDEEQRFGVTHKERLKQMRTEVDVLTLTATPIPRTLYMSLTGVRDISMIQTPPEERLPVITYTGHRDDNMIRQAILREMDRGGQVFYVHNRVQTIYSEAEKLRQIVPEAEVAVAHGQMPEAELEAAMHQFAEGSLNVLVSTSIIEAGLDIPNANTLIVDRSDLFGLAQLYQLRGRVGRSANRAFAYLFHPPLNSLTPEARARLETIAEETDLGAGVNIAMRDLELRGAGDILGVRQHGMVAAVGFHLYTRMLSQAVARLKAERDGGDSAGSLVPTGADDADQPMVTIDLPIPTYIPTDYVTDPALRIQLYRRMAELTSEEQIEALNAEILDRFGPLPEPTQNLLYQLRVRRLAQLAGLEAVTSEGGQVSLRMAGLAHIDRQALQAVLGDGIRVSRTGIWLSRHGDISQHDWMPELLVVLHRLRQWKETRTPESL